MTPPKLKRGSSVKKTTNDKECPHHNLVMAYDPGMGHWTCPDKSCNYRLVPKADVERGSAALQRGPFELFVVLDHDNVQNYLIRDLKSNVIFDVTDHLKKVHGEGADTTIEMHFDNVAIKEKP